MSRESLRDQLAYEGFTSEQANYGVSNISVDWNEQAVKSAESYLSFSSFSKKSLTRQLRYEGFTKKQTAYAIKKVF